MKRLYPLKFSPLLKEKIWGGCHLQGIFNHLSEQHLHFGEAWLLSGIEGEESIVCNGWLSDNNINELIEVFMGDLIGDKVYDSFGNQFPLLFKIIDASDDLSVQLHPNDKTARKHGLKQGKSEMWYIMQAKENAQLISGFNTKLDTETLKELLLQNRLETVLNVEKIDVGDVFYIPAGIVHSIGKGILLAEIQQASDTTYRLYDWNRIDENGNMRELHINKALEAIDYTITKNQKITYIEQNNKTIDLVKSSYFITNLLTTNIPVKKNFLEMDSFVVYFCMNGNGYVLYENESINFSTGELLLIPNCVNDILIVPSTPLKILEVYIP